MLEGRNVPADKIFDAISLAEHFENYILATGKGFTPEVAWEVIFEQAIRVDVLDSALQGDDRCRFAIHLPSQLSIPASSSNQSKGA